jgi:hypothetical protein
LGFLAAWALAVKNSWETFSWVNEDIWAAMSLLTKFTGSISLLIVTYLKVNDLISRQLSTGYSFFADSN